MISILRFSNILVYGEPRYKPGPKTSFPYAGYLPFTKAYLRVMVLFGKASRAGLRADVRVEKDGHGKDRMSGEIEVRNRGS